MALISNKFNISNYSNNTIGKSINNINNINKNNNSVNIFNHQSTNEVEEYDLFSTNNNVNNKIGQVNIRNLVGSGVDKSSTIVKKAAKMMISSVESMEKSTNEFVNTLQASNIIDDTQANILRKTAKDYTNLYNNSISAKADIVNTAMENINKNVDASALNNSIYNAAAATIDSTVSAVNGNNVNVNNLIKSYTKVGVEATKVGLKTGQEVASAIVENKEQIKKVEESTSKVINDIGPNVEVAAAMLNNNDSIEKIKIGVEQANNNIKAGVEQVNTNIKNNLEQVNNNIKDSLKNIDPENKLENLQNHINQVGENIKNSIGNMGEKISVDDIKNHFEQTNNSIRSAIEKMSGELTLDSLRSYLDQINSNFDNLLNNLNIDKNIVEKPDYNKILDYADYNISYYKNKQETYIKELNDAINTLKIIDANGNINTNLSLEEATTAFATLSTILIFAGRDTLQSALYVPQYSLVAARDVYNSAFNTLINVKDKILGNESPKEIKVYTSLGDSVQSGWGLDDYNKYNKTIVANKSIKGSSPQLIGKSLGAEVNQLHMPGARTNELLYILWPDNPLGMGADWVTDSQLPELSGGTYSKVTLNASRAEYIKAIKEADVITLDIGMNDLWVSPMSAIYEIAKDGRTNTKGMTVPEMVEKYGAYGAIDDTASSLVRAITNNPDKWGEYTALMGDAMLNWVIDQPVNQFLIAMRIHQLNPNAELVVCGGYNPVEGWDIIPGMDDNIISQGMSLFYEGFQNIGKRMIVLMYPGKATYVDMNGVEIMSTDTTVPSFETMSVDADGYNPHPTKIGAQQQADKILTALDKESPYTDVGDNRYRVVKDAEDLSTYHLKDTNNSTINGIKSIVDKAIPKTETQLKTEIANSISAVFR